MAEAAVAPTEEIGALRDETWRAKNRPDNLFGSSIVEESMRCFVLKAAEAGSGGSSAANSGEGSGAGGEGSSAGSGRSTAANSGEGSGESTAAGEGEVVGEQEEKASDAGSVAAGGSGKKRGKAKGCWVVGVESVKMNHALMQIVREMVMNCTDLVERDPEFRKISVCFDAADGSITVRNDGRGIPIGRDLIRIDDETRRAALDGLWSPTLLLARWGCSSNYDDSKVRFTAGKNGLGAKAVLAWCDRVELRAVDSVRKRSFTQSWRDGMRTESAPKVKENVAAKKGYTELKLWPAYSSLVKLDLPLSEDQVAALRWCVWECSTVLPKGDRFGVSIDGVSLPDHTPEGMIKSVAQFAMSAAGGSAAEASSTPTIIRSESVWGEAKESITGFAVPMHMVDSSVLSSLPSLGFVNGVPCPKGTHRQRWESALVTDIRNKVEPSSSAASSSSSSSSSLTKGALLGSLYIVTCARINQPRFASQTKDELVTRIPASVTLSGTVNVNALARSGYIAHLKALRQSRQDDAAMKLLAPVANLKKSAGGSRRNDVEEENYEGAEMAGRTKPCFLFLTEGLSAQNCARNVIARLPAEIKGRCGSYALRGKLINAMSNPMAKVWANKEIQALVKIANLNPSCTYERDSDRDTLRYSKLILWTDADTDGGHIAWLVFVFVHRFWPRLAASGFVERFVTPLLKIYRPGGAVLQFYSEAARDRWLEDKVQGAIGGGGAGSSSSSSSLATTDMVRRALDHSVDGRIKYYKGLGRLMAEDEMDLARRFDDLRIAIQALTAEDVDLVTKIGSDSPDARRVVQLTRSIRALPYDDIDTISIGDFVDGELLPYMRDANLRQIPGIDGFVEVSRMILAYFFVKPSAADPGAEHVVARLAAAIAAELDYHHGETSMAGAIATMAQDFAGKNNMNLLQPRGQFGTRSEPSPASPRYTNTALSSYVSALFPRADYRALPMPRHGEVPCYMPGVLPMLLVNGATGIGYGHSTDIPQHHPLRVLEACRKWIDRHVGVLARSEGAGGGGGGGEEHGECLMDLRDLHCLDGVDMCSEFESEVAGSLGPWIRGLAVQPVWNEAAEVWESRGKVEVVGPRQLRITELPVGLWTLSYRAALSKLPWVVSSFMHANISSVLIDVDLSADLPFSLDDPEELLKALKLVRKISYTNMKAFDRHGSLTSFSSPARIVHEFGLLRVWLYARRKSLEMGDLARDLAVAESRRAFVEAQVEDRLRLREFTSKAAAHVEMDRLGIGRVDGTFAHLDGLSMWQSTRDEVDKLKRKVVEIRAVLEELSSKQPWDLWREELDAAAAELGRSWREGRLPEDMGAAKSGSSSSSASGQPAKKARNGAGAGAGRGRK